MLTAARSRQGFRPICAGAALFVATLLWRGWQLGSPATLVFDEIFYANDAVDLVLRGIEQTRVGHPLLGKWLIGIGFAFGHFSPTSWRAASLVAGAIVVVTVFATVRRLTTSTALGTAAGILVLSDGIAHEMGRYAFLDGFVSMFTTALLAVLVFSRGRAVTYRLSLLIGALVGAALATKWSASPIVLLTACVVFMRARRQGGSGRAIVLMATLVGAAILVFLASYGPWIITGSESGNCTEPACESSAVARLVRVPAMQLDMLRSDAQVPRRSPFLHPGWEWAIQRNSMGLFRENCSGFDDGVCHRSGRSDVVVVMRGNRVLWLSFWPALAAWLWWGRRRSRAPRAAALVAGWAGALWLPWAFLPNTFLYYAAPMVPALAIFLVVALAETVPRRIQPLVISAVVAAALFVFVVGQPAAPWRS